ncbi:MAG: hypothetical protein JWP44_491 [Mucilaginibacter sp.]|nr:hypothetical protein [Mucilaginibacter sp.]
MKIPKSVTLSAILLFLFFGCKKSSNNPVPVNSNAKLSLVSGSNQSAAIGYWLKDSIVVKVTNNGLPVSNVDIQFIGSGCNEDLITDVKTKADGTAKYFWILAANQGTQTLDAVAIIQNERIDSIAINATAVSSAGQPLRSACTPNPGGQAQRILRLSTGRLIACFPGKTSMRYSDDNGKSWNPIKSFGPNYTVAWITTSPQDEIFAATTGDGIFYSKDAGNTWTNITPSTFNKQDKIDDIAFTIDGKLIFTGSANDIYVSPDKGTTWTSSGNGLNTTPAYQNPVELQNGDLYILSFANILYKSSDNGKNWTAQNNAQNERVTGIYVDKNGWFYKASDILFDEVILISKDNGATFNGFVDFHSEAYIINISMQSDGYLYFGRLGGAIGMVYNGTQDTNSYCLTDEPFPAYVIAKNNSLVYSNSGGIFY